MPLMNFEEQVRRHKEISKTIEALEEEKKALGVAIMLQMTGKTATVSDFLVRRQQRLSIAVTLDEARKHSATKMEETVDKEKIKALYNDGTPVKGVSEIHYIAITNSKKATSAEPPSLEELPTF